jgi:outer membrane protein TolC
MNVNRHEGAIQDVLGSQLETSRGAIYGGLGAGGYGAGSPAVPGLFANFHLADAAFQPLAAAQFARSRRSAAVAATNDTLWKVAVAYMELLHSLRERQNAAETLDEARRLADLTGTYAKSGQGLEADYDRSRAELAFRTNEARRADEAVGVASARLAQLLRLDPATKFSPLEPALAPIEVVPAGIPLADLVAEGLSTRPELAQHRALVREAVERLRREQYGPILPSLVLGVSYGGMSAGLGSDLAGMDGRLDLDAMAYWELRNLGLGERASRDERRSELRQTQLRQLDVLDQIAREIVEAHSQVEARRQQIDTALMGLQAAGDSYRRNLDRINAAQGLPLEVLQSLQALAQARREYARAIVDSNIAAFTLHRSLGWPLDTAVGIPAAVPKSHVDEHRRGRATAPASQTAQSIAVRKPAERLHSRTAAMSATH